MTLNDLDDHYTYTRLHSGAKHQCNILFSFLTPSTSVTE